LGVWDARSGSAQRSLVGVGAVRVAVPLLFSSLKQLIQSHKLITRSHAL
jgi:hypothetical protein